MKRGQFLFKVEEIYITHPFQTLKTTLLSKPVKYDRTVSKTTLDTISQGWLPLHTVWMWLLGQRAFIFHHDLFTFYLFPCTVSSPPLPKHICHIKYRVKSPWSWPLLANAMDQMRHPWVFLHSLLPQCGLLCWLLNLRCEGNFKGQPYLRWLLKKEGGRAISTLLSLWRMLNDPSVLPIPSVALWTTTPHGK